LEDLGILRFANAEPFKLPPHHAAALVEMIEEIEQQPSTTHRDPHRRVWIYAPGEDAEHWDEFYESSIMAIGWDSLGDLSRFGSVKCPFHAGFFVWILPTLFPCASVRLAAIVLCFHPGNPPPQLGPVGLIKFASREERVQGVYLTK
jgi:hypothetical protein